MLLNSASSIKIKCVKPAITILAVFLLFALFGYWKFGESIGNPGLCLTNGGDGIGGIGDLFTLKQEVDENGLSALWGDTRWSDRVGFGLSAPVPTSTYWKWHFAILQQFFSPDNVYDVIGVLAFVLIGLFGFVLLREMGVSVPFSLLGGILLMHLDHFFSRLNGHLIGLGTYYVPILLCWGAVRAGKNPTIIRLIILAVLSVLNFLVNEYYGYYGLFFSVGLFLGYLLKCINKDSPEIGKIALRIALSGVVFLGLMCLFYPNLIMIKIADLFQAGPGSEIVIHNANHSWGQFLFYSVRKPLSFFSSSLPYMRDLMSGELFRNDLGEFSFRIGIVLPLAILGAIVFFGYSSVSRKLENGKAVISECVIWISISVLMFFFAISPEKSISLVPITYRIAPMFRVGTRAFLYIDIAVIVLFAYTMDLVFRIMIKNCGPGGSIRKRVANGPLLLLLVFITVVAVIDVTGGRIWKKAHALRLPDTDVYEALAGKPEGLVLELPMFSPITDPPERNYIYMYNRSKHGFNMVNTSYPPPSNSEFSEALHGLSLYFNAICPEVVDDWKRTGVRYIVVDKAKIDDSQLRNSKQLNLIADTKSKSIFETHVDEDFGRDDFLETFIYSQPSLSFGGSFHQPQRSDKTYWIWGGKSGDIIFKNHSKYDKKVVFTATFVARVGSTLQITTLFSRDTVYIRAPSAKFSKIFDIKANSSLTMNIVSDAKPYKPSDPALIFCMYEYGVRILFAN
ncbi:MAG: hypothetical protein B6I30_01980 [Desulfobacteraceae bacterium 4572_187]|nr:MAG: hypothetical protein B6I30_01980 [Desulfobacteraceae bacterium 4572_187]